MARKVATQLDLLSNRIVNVADPTGPQDAATKAYVDASAQGLDIKESVLAATTANITLSGAQTIDGVAVGAGDRVLVKDQTTASENGIYEAAAGAWARAPDADTSADVTPGMFTFVEQGTANGDTGWVLTTDAPITLGTTALAFSQFSGGGDVTAGAGLTKTGQTIDVGGTLDRITVGADAVDIASTYAGQTSIATLGTIATGAWEATDVGIAHGGTGASDAATARANLGGLTRKFTQLVGDAAATSIAVTHNLGTTAVVVQVQKESTGEVYIVDVTVTDANTVTLGFATAPALNEFRVTVVG